MPRVIYINTDGSRETIEADVGASVMEAAVANGIEGIVAECGGSLMCATCHVYIDEDYLDRLPEKSVAEDEMLDGTSSERNEYSRLSCQIKLTPELDGLIVHLPETQV